MIYGNIINGNLEPVFVTNNEIFKKEQENGITTMSINLQKKSLLTRVYINEIYNTNFLIENVAENTNSNLPIYTNVVVDKIIPQWIFKELLPLPRYMNSNGVIVNGESRIQLVSINYLPCDFETLEIGILLNDDISKIDLSNIANKSAFNRMYSGEGDNRKRVFFVNKVTLLARFEEKDPLEVGTFKYYEGTVLTNCDNFEYANDWALKLPECYEDCEIDEDDATQLVMKFGTYEQFDLDAYLLKNVTLDNNLYLDVSMSINDISTISKVKIELKKMKYFNSVKGRTATINFNSTLNPQNSIRILFNNNGFIEVESFQPFEMIKVIDNCYVIGGNNRLEGSTKMIEPSKNVFMVYNNKKCIKLEFYAQFFVTMKDYLCTNIYDEYDDALEKINILTSGEIPSWIMEYMPLPINLKYLEFNETYGHIYELTDEDDYDLQIISVNALPTPDGDIGIDNIN